MMGFVWSGGKELDGLLPVVDRLLAERVWARQHGGRRAWSCFRSRASRPARKASFEFSEKSAAKRIVSKGLHGSSPLE